MVRPVGSSCASDFNQALTLQLALSRGQRRLRGGGQQICQGPEVMKAV